MFQYNENNAWHRFDARIKEKNVDLLLVDAKGQARVMSSTSYAQPIAGTDVCYEDLSLRFLYWKDGKVVTDGVETRVKGRDCWVVQVANPNPSTGQFAWVRMWVDKENGTSWQIDGYGRDGKLKKRFSITSVQKLSDGTWFFKQMKVEVRNPQNPDHHGPGLSGDGRHQEVTRPVLRHEPHQTRDIRATATGGLCIGAAVGGPPLYGG